MRGHREPARYAASEGSEFDAGYEFGFRQALSRIQNQAIGFDISLEEIGLHGFDPLLDPLE